MAGCDPFDVVVVGGGAAGCVVAARLAEQASRSVLLLDAGPDRRSDLPEEMWDGWTIRSSQFDWGYTSEPGPNASSRPTVWPSTLPTAQRSGASAAGHLRPSLSTTSSRPSSALRRSLTRWEPALWVCA